MLVSSADMLARAEAGHYAVAQFNINNLEWIRAILQAAQETSSPVILGVTESAAGYMGGLRGINGLVRGMLEWLKIDVPVALHLDHSSLWFCLEAIGAGFTSVMFDGSKLPFAENLATCEKLAALCKKRGISLEAEVGSPAGEEDGISGSGEKADPAQCARLAKSGITMLAASIGNIHGSYPADWPGLDQALLGKIRQSTGNLPLVLHGGTGIPEAMVREAIAKGICKINVNTECQQAFTAALRQYFMENRDRQEKGYNPQKLFAPAIKAIQQKAIEKMSFFGCIGKAADSRTN